MRLVRGRTLRQAVADHHARRKAGTVDPLEFPRLLQAFVSVCQAVGYAHKRGVIHRDLKPENVVLGADGEVILLDWGLAKVVGDPSDDHPSVDLTDQAATAGTVGAVGTPAYMSPEQAAGRVDLIDARTDVYGLGAILFEILTGRPPHLGDGTADHLVRVAQGETPRARSVDPTVPAPLDAVCAHAMARDRSDRYPSARALADDLDRWMADQPVGVYADPVTTRLFRWARQHKPLVASSLALLVSAVVGLAAATAVVGEQKARAERARDQANAARIDAERSRNRADRASALARDHLKVGLDLVDQLVSLGDRQLLTQLSVGARQRFLDSAVAFIRRFREREPGDAVVQSQTALITRRLANVYALTGKFAQADPFHDEAVTILSALAGAPGAAPTVADLLAEALIDRGDALLTRGRAAAAEADFHRACDLSDRNARAEPANADYRFTRARSLAALAEARLTRGRDDAEGVAREAVDGFRPPTEASLLWVREATHGGNNRPMIERLSLIHALVTLAEAETRVGRPADADAQLREALGRAGQLADAFPGQTIPDVAYASARPAIRLARSLPEGRGDAEAKSLLDGAVAKMTEVTRGGGDILHFRIALADALAARARVLARTGRDEPAEADAQAARARLKALTSECPEVPEPFHVLADALDTLARLTDRGPAGAEGARDWLAQAVTAEKAALALNPENPAYEARLAGYRARLDALNKR
jgi:tetratricopeptide (TPR) repeat protein